MRMAMEIYLGALKDPTGGAMWYHAEYVVPSWRNMFKRGPKIGQHIFYQLSPSNRY
jgi:spore germination cell wall hydrolase CwlJ-like protein